MVDVQREPVRSPSLSQGPVALGGFDAVTGSDGAAALVGIQAEALRMRSPALPDFRQTAGAT